MYIKHVLTHNSAYEINEEAETITRRPILGQSMAFDDQPVFLMSYTAEVGNSLSYSSFSRDAVITLTTTSPILSIATVTQ